MNYRSTTNSQLIKAEAQRLGFMACGIAKAERLNEHEAALEGWLKQGMHAGMAYMEQHFDLRLDPTLLVPGAKSVITLLMNYFPSAEQQHNAVKIARYAWGADYHDVIRDRLKALLAYMRSIIGEIQGRGFVDSAPVLERAWAQRSGLGWFGKNANLLNRQSGSFFFIATLITDVELDIDPPFATDHCGTCTRCIDACPTDALIKPGVVDSNRCISYVTIELKGAQTPESFEGDAHGWLFGCDVCQEVCPWNRFARPHQEAAFEPIPEILNLDHGAWEAMTEYAFKQIFRKSPLKRAKWAGIQRNLRLVRPGKEAVAVQPNSKGSAMAYPAPHTSDTHEK